MRGHKAIQSSALQFVRHFSPYYINEWKWNVKVYFALMDTTDSLNVILCQSIPTEFLPLFDNVR